MASILSKVYQRPSTEEARINHQGLGQTSNVESFFFLILKSSRMMRQSVSVYVNAVLRKRPLTHKIHKSCKLQSN